MNPFDKITHDLNRQIVALENEREELRRYVTVIERQRDAALANIGQLVAAFHLNMIVAYPERSHDEVAAEVNRIAGDALEALDKLKAEERDLAFNRVAGWFYSAPFPWGREAADFVRLVAEGERYEDIERRHLGDPDKQTGIYAKKGERSD